MSWLSFVFPKKLQKREAKVKVELEAIHMTHAMGRLERERVSVKSKKNEMHDLLNSALEKIESRHRK